MTKIILWLWGLWLTWRIRKIDTLEALADIALDRAWSKPVHWQRLPLGTLEQDLLQQFRELEREVEARRQETYKDKFMEENMFLHMQMQQDRASQFQQALQQSAMQQFMPRPGKPQQLGLGVLPDFWPPQ